MTRPASSSLGVWVDSAICIGSEHCVRLAPGAFVIGDDGVAHVRDPDATTLDKLRLAERSCPTGAIFIEPEG